MPQTTPPVIYYTRVPYFLFVMSDNVLKLGLPKGSLQESTFNIFRKAGFRISVPSRSYYPRIDDPEIDCMLMRAQEIARYVELGFLDCGLTGYDWVMENNADVEFITELIYSKQNMRPVKWVLCVPATSGITSVKQLEGKTIATEVVNITKKYLKDNGVTANVEFSWGATEAKPPKLADAIVEVTETGSTIKANNLVIIDELMQSTTRLIANKKAWSDKWKQEKIKEVSMLLEGALLAEEKVGLKMNIQEDAVESLIKELPALKNPTVSSLSEPGWVAVETIIDESRVRELIPRLKKLGAEGIIEYPLNKIIP
jgi:ATP phosphoribosyltransferase